MKQNLLFSLLMLFGLSLTAQDNINMTLVSNVQFNENSSDIWGFVDANGIEYAIIGTATNTRIYSLENPASPIERAVVPGASSIWRDIKSWKTHIYVTTDQGTDGLVIIDMTDAPETITYDYWKPSLTVEGNTSPLERCHNIYIDEKGYAYLAGCNIANRGVIMLDVDTDPNAPIYLGAADLTYSHDAYTRGDTLYASEINIGEFSIYDISDPSDPMYLGGAETSMNFTHNAWLSDDGNTLFTTDERANGYVDSYDISDLGNIKRLDIYQPIATAGENVIPHNTHFLDNYLITSWYTDGIVITDVTDPSNIIKVGAFDTWDGANGGFNGCWGAYPFLPSGLILGSDIQTGLYVFQPNYTRAARLEGTVTNKLSGDAINNASVEIINTQPNATTTDPSGEYKTGIVETGLKSVTFSHPEYFSKTIDGVNFNNGNVITLNAELERKESVSFSVNTIKSTDGTPLADCEVILISESTTVKLTTDGGGIVNSSAFADSYDVYVGKWGYLQKVVSDVNLFTTPVITVDLEVGYEDDFIFDLGWTSSGNGSSGFWEKAIPNPTDFGGSFSNVNEDIQGDLGDECYVTGNELGGAGADDVDGGNVVLTSMDMDLSGYTNPRIEYNAWFFNDGGQGTDPNDKLTISITNGVQTVILEEITESQSNWRDRSVFNLNGMITLNANMQLIVETADDDPGHLVEGGFDAFKVLDGLVSTNEIASYDITVSPNPFADQVQIDFDYDGPTNIAIINNQGQVIRSIMTDSNRNSINLKELNAGMYIIQINDMSGRTIASEKIIKGN